MDFHVIDTALRHALGYADAVRLVQRQRGLDGPFGDASELGFARHLAREAAADPANAAALTQIADHLQLTSELMSFHHHRIDWESAHDRVNWGYVSVTVRTIAIALHEVVPAPVAVEATVNELRLTPELITGLASSLSVDGADRLITALGEARRTASGIDPTHRLDDRVRGVALTPWPVVSGVTCAA